MRAAAAVGALAFALTVRAADVPGCALFLRAIDGSGATVMTPLVAPQDVASVQFGGADAAGAEIWHFRLAPAAARRLHDYTARNIGRPLAIYCGGTEVDRPLIQAPVSDQVVVRRPPAGEPSR